MKTEKSNFPWTAEKAAAKVAAKAAEKAAADKVVVKKAKD